MEKECSRRNFIATTALAAGVATLGTTLAVASTTETAGKIKIIGISGSPRRGKTTVESLTLALEAAKEIDPNRIEIEIIELLDYNLFESERVLGSNAVKGNGSFAKLEEKLADPMVRGILVGSPVHNSMLSLMTSAFFAQIDHKILQGKVGGALAVGGARNGGQESTVSGINTYLFHEGVILPGTGKSGRIGALLWNQKDTVAADEFGIKLTKILGQRIAKVALALPADLLESSS